MGDVSNEANSTIPTIPTMSASKIVTNLTPAEAKFLISCLNYDTVEKQLGDNFSNAGIMEAMSLFDHADKFRRRQAAGGLLTSLHSKGLGTLDIEFDQFCLTEKGVRTAFAYRNASEDLRKAHSA